MPTKVFFWDKKIVFPRVAVYKWRISIQNLFSFDMQCNKNIQSCVTLHSHPFLIVKNGNKSFQAFDLINKNEWRFFRPICSLLLAFKSYHFSIRIKFSRFLINLYSRLRWFEWEKEIQNKPRFPFTDMSL